MIVACVVCTRTSVTPNNIFIISIKHILRHNIEKQICLKNNYACWDFYNIMGGLGSVVKWKKLGLGNYDMTHFLNKGYEVQGKLLYHALMNSYNNSHH